MPPQHPDNDGNLPMHAAVEYQASDEVIALLTKRCAFALVLPWFAEACSLVFVRYAGATREMNHLKKLPVDIANENGASVYGHALD